MPDPWATTCFACRDPEPAERSERPPQPDRAPQQAEPRRDHAPRRHRDDDGPTPKRFGDFVPGFLMGGKK